jgi:[acyl-carrier-protein] S-malonyltransferase
MAPIPAIRRAAWLFPGQGSEHPRMGLDLAARSERGRALLERAGHAAGVDARRVLERGGEAFGRTDVMQPLLVAVCGITAEALRAAGHAPDLVAGHSVGELGAWSAAGCIEPEDAIDLAALRGRLMAREATRRPGGMLALVDCDEAAAERAIERGRRHGAVDLAASNAPDEWVLTGEHAALAAIAASAPSVRLPVAGPWHSRAMEDAVEELRVAMERVTRRPSIAPMVVNRTGLVAPRDDLIPGLLAGQLTRPIEWARSLMTLVEAGVTEIVTIGPGKVLRGLIRKNLGDRVRVLTTESPSDWDRTLEALRR